MIPWLPDLTLQQLLQRVVAVLLVSSVYGGLLALLARWMGDRGPTYDGRLTMNPFVHLAMAGVVAALFFRATWVKPVQLDPTSMRHRLAPAVIVVVSSAALLLFGAALLTLRPWVLTVMSGNGAIAASGVLNASFEVAALTALLNLLPIPALAGEAWLLLGGSRVARLVQQPRLRFAGAVLALLCVAWANQLGIIRATLSTLRSLVGY
jgi:hypothetical protein